MSKKVYESAPAEVAELCAQVIAEVPNHKHFRDLEIKISLVMVSKFDASEQIVRCLKHHGAFADAVVRLIPCKERLHNAHDVEITIDKFAWDGANTLRKKALLDHELTHVAVKLSKKDNEPMVHDDGRPMLRLLPDDYSITGFYSIADRHGVFSGEVASVSAIASRMHLSEMFAAPANVDQNPPPESESTA